MKIIKGLLIAVGIGVLWKGSQAKKFLDQLTWIFKNVHLDFNASLLSGFSKIYLVLNVSFTNNTNFSIDVSRIVCDVYYNGLPLGSINKDIPFIIKAQEFNDLALPVVIQVSQAGDIMTEFINHLQDMTQTMQLNFKGHIQTALGNIPFDETKYIV